MKKPSAQIHPTALIDSKAKLGRGVVVGPFSIIEAGAVIGAGAQIGPHCLITGHARLGGKVRMFKGAVVGTDPQDLKFGGEESELIVGERTTIREFCTLNRGTAHGHLKTTVGADCLLMAYSHVAHDCTIGDNVILANGVNLAGHVTIEDWASLSGLVVVHQFVKIGRHCYIGGLSRVSQDVPPYVLVNGIPPEYFGPNAVGLKRRGFTSKQVARIKKVYHYIYQANLNLTQALEAIKSELELTDEVKVILDFIEHSKRGLTGL
jgi:UDP-N-acetylglucosamine acyltransferase